jgi:hypothetical protein
MGILVRDFDRRYKYHKMTVCETVQPPVQPHWFQTRGPPSAEIKKQIDLVRKWQDIK